MEYNSLNSYNEDEDFNFWPSFADLMLSIVLILVLIMFTSIVYISQGKLNLSQVTKKQMEVIHDIAAVSGVDVQCKRQLGDEYNECVIEEQGIAVKNELTLQRFTFSDNILFYSDSYEINEKGKLVLSKVGNEFKKRIKYIGEIQIQGHADTDNTTIHGTNMKLAALRSIAVFEFLRDNVGIDPVRQFMSATSFGEYMPACRKPGDSFDLKRLKECNKNNEDKRKNRRIEILLFYKNIS
ncbi:MAG: OmpA family protein [Nitrospirae bacterium]|nr:OmpA family protein [Nitrospirota bacterium]